jgi:hypothetical protein
MTRRRNDATSSNGRCPRRPKAQSDHRRKRPKPGSPLESALAYLRARTSIIPVRLDGSKAPQLRIWGKYQEQPADEDQLREWFDREQPPGIGIVGGKVSGGVFVLDCEFLDLFEEWVALVEAQAPGLIARLPIVHTPGKDEKGGRHVYARSSGPAVPSRKLARITAAEAEQRTGDPRRTTAIEVKGERGYVLAPGCPAECHPSGRLYQHIAGPAIEETPTLDDAEVELLLACARALERGDKASADKRPEPAADARRPGDDFDRRASWDNVFPSGWKKVWEHGEVTYLRRPGKDIGVSATIGYCKSERGGPKLYVFSTNAEPFEAERSYSKFEAYTVLHHGGDFKAAARELARQGYGDSLPHADGQGSSAMSTCQDPEGLHYTVGPLSVWVAKQRAKWCIIVSRGEEVLGAAVVNVADIKGRGVPVAFGKLIYLYTGTTDFDRDCAWFRDVLGGDRVWAIHAFGAKVAAFRMGEGPQRLVRFPLHSCERFFHCHSPAKTSFGSRCPSCRASMHSCPRWCAS